MSCLGGITVAEEGYGAGPSHPDLPVAGNVLKQPSLSSLMARLMVPTSGSFEWNRLPKSPMQLKMKQSYLKKSPGIAVLHT